MHLHHALGRCLCCVGGVLPRLILPGREIGFPGAFISILKATQFGAYQMALGFGQTRDLNPNLLMNDQRVPPYGRRRLFLVSVFSVAGVYKCC